MLMIWAEAAVPHNVRNRNRKVGFLSMQLKYSKRKKAAISTGLVILCLGYPRHGYNLNFLIVIRM